MATSQDPTTVIAWFAERLPEHWFQGPPTVRVDKDEILIVGALTIAEDGQDVHETLIAFREATRADRMKIAETAQKLWQRSVSWGAICGEVEARFTTASVPVMTRLKIDERQVLDTLIDAGVARSRSEALAWCVQQVGQHQREWIERLQVAMSEVERIRSEGPN